MYLAHILKLIFYFSPQVPTYRYFMPLKSLKSKR
jgi:hypothetical protein